MKNRCGTGIILRNVLLVVCLAALFVGKSRGDQDSRYLDAVREFADNVLKYGRDTYGPKHTPLFVDGLNIHTHEPVKWIDPDGTRWILSNLASQQNLFRTLDGLTKITDDPKYKQVAMEAIKYAFDNLRSPNGLLYWGQGNAYDAQADRPRDKKKHSLRIHYPYYELMWEVNPSFTRQFIEAVWSSQILDWSNLDMQRFEEVHERFENPWQHEYKGGPVFFPSKICNGVSSIIAGSDLYYAAGILSKLSGEEEPLVWSKRLAQRYVETRDTNTGIGGTSYSLREDNPAQAQFGDDFRGYAISMGTLFPAVLHGEYVHPVKDIEIPQITRTGAKLFGVQGGLYYGLRAWICQFLLGETLGDDGKEFIRWALEELTARGRFAYRKKDNSFIPMLTDGTSLEGYVLTKDGLFGPKGTILKARRASYIHFWAYAVGYRLTADEFMWEMARSIAEGNGFGDIGTPANNKLKLAMDTDCSEPHALLGFLELYGKTQNDTFLSMASRIGDNILVERFHRGFFVPTKKHLYTRFDYLEPLVLLRLEATIRKTPIITPQVWPSGAAFMFAYRGVVQACDVDVIYTLTESSELPISLPEASAGGDIDEVRSLIAKGADVNGWDTSKIPPLHFAAMNGHKQVAELLIAEGADVNAGNSDAIKPLHYAVENGHKEIAELLIAHGAEVNATRGYPAGDTPLHSAVKAGHRCIVKLLLANGVDINAKNNDGQTPVDIAVSWNRKELVELFIAKGADVSLHTASRFGDLAIVESLIQKGACINAKDASGQTPLHHAAEGGHKDVVELLIANGANVNAKDNDGNTPGHVALDNNNNRSILELLIAKGANFTSIHLSAYRGSLDEVRSFIDKGVNVNAKSKSGETPLHKAAIGGHKDIVKLLIDNAADINATEQRNYTPVHYAVWSYNIETVELLIEKGADVNAKDRWGWTPLHYMAKDDNIGMTQLLITKGADVNARDNSGETALAVAKGKGYTKMVELLRKHGAKER